MIIFASQEIDRTCQQIIRDNVNWCNLVTSRTPPPPCMFEEIEGIVPDRVMDSSDDFMNMFKKVNNCKLKSHQWCLTHKRQCALVGAGPDYDCAGLPCWDYSFAGKRLQEEGETKRVFIAYAAYHCSQRTPLLVIENVKAWCSKIVYCVISVDFRKCSEHVSKIVQGLRIEMIKWLFCLHYDIHILVCGVEDQGHDGASRDRLWIILSHKERTKQLFDPAELYRMVCKSIRTYVCTKPADDSIAPTVEIKNEAMHLAAVRNKKIMLAGLQLIMVGLHPL